MKNLISKIGIILALTSPAITVDAAKTVYKTDYISVADENSKQTSHFLNTTAFTDTVNSVTARKDRDVKGKGEGINEAGIKRADSQRKGWDGTVKGGITQKKTINGINNSMPNRISMNITVAKQTQGATFGEKVNAGLHTAGKINISLVEDGCMVLFPDNEGYRVYTENQCIRKLTDEELRKVNAGLHAAGGALASGASLLGGALPGGSIVSVAISSISSLAGGGGAAAASYAATGRTVSEGKDNDCDGTADIVADVTRYTGEVSNKKVDKLSTAKKVVWKGKDDDCDGTVELTDGDYELSFVVIEKATSGLKDTLKTQVRIQFSSISNVLKTKHDTAKNAIGNVR
ncbi:MAG: hypothetical protein H6Q19_1471 [Bacteroidetes bacterium]|nr:hypothetical protein [Bacteroidota bacterium]